MTERQPQVEKTRLGGKAYLTAAQMAKNDEFYTLMPDIEAELKHYAAHFDGKVVYCNCDNPASSNFYLYFKQNFARLNLKKLVCTYYAPGGQSSKTELLPCGTETSTQLQGDGDFRSPECEAILQEADLVVTNPPFSLLRQYLSQLMKHDKKFIVMGSYLVVGWPSVFPYIFKGRMRLGSKSNIQLKFKVPGHYKYDPKLDDAEGNHYAKVQSITWYQNIHTFKRTAPVLTAKYDPAVHRKYDNFDAINVDRLKDIPCDYYGLMGVPITYYTVHDEDLFELVGLLDNCNTSANDGIYGGIPMETVCKEGRVHKNQKLGVIDSVAKFSRYLIRRKQ